MPGSTDLTGRRISEVRPMTREELDDNFWPSHPWLSPIVLVLDDGTRLFASQDEEGNGPGALFGIAPDGEHFGLHLMRVPGRR